jgi:hypothetical protein
MGIDIGNIINSTVNWICNDSIVATIISNAFLTSILIVLIILLIVRHYFNTKKVNMPRFVGYLFIIISGILFVHYSAVVQKADKKYKNKAEAAIIENLSKPMEYSPIAAVPQLQFSSQTTQPSTQSSSQSSAQSSLPSFQQEKTIQSSLIPPVVSSP